MCRLVDLIKTNRPEINEGSSSSCLRLSQIYARASVAGIIDDVCSCQPFAYLSLLPKLLMS